MPNPSGSETLAIEGAVLGRVDWHWAWWTDDPGVFVVEVWVEPLHRGRAHGTALFEKACHRLRALGAHTLTAWVSSDAPDALAFATRMGYAETGERQQTCVLDLASASPSVDPHAPISSVVDLAPSEAFLREMHRIDGDTRGSFEAWRMAALEGEGQSLETTWVWVEDGRPVGMTYLTRVGGGDYENDFTVVRRDHRRRGIANAAMREANRKLGYVEGPQLLELTRRI